MGGPGLETVKRKEKALERSAGFERWKYLQQERERKGLSLEAVSLATRISSRNLEAIENDDFVSCRPQFLSAVFLKTYASFIGLEPYKVISLYETPDRNHRPSSFQGLQPEKRPPRRIWLLAIPLLMV